ncbi:hypothetical protein PPYR_11924 [Photinus pyralis]|uniref:Protein croquemort n=1 Tax=Photinus pyralis TaxID=7054 RepID=A0A5N4ACN1_PHOPY|nr:protein peste-like [Photinus pyralis]XP_031350726.1 protein peste-like [Photinus pyralis]KAB0795085.1 hypothetical protein PPYR_11924 [Photinus pyralis]
MNPFLEKLARRSGPSMIAASFFTFGVVFLLLWNWIFDRVLASILVLNTESQVFEPWRTSPVPITMDVYFFNWTNPEEIYDHSKKPAFAELGPYRFTEHREKVNFTWNENGTVTYRLWRRWYFEEGKSAGRLTDKITTINPATMVAANHVKNWNYFTKRGLSHAFSVMGYEIHTVKSVGELIFDGYDEPLLKVGPLLGIDLPSADKFGWFHPRNNSYTFDGTINVDTGYNGSLGEVKSWNYKENIDFYTGKCRQITGSAGELYPRHRKRDSISVFSTDTCRSMQLDYKEDTLVKGIQGYKYSAQAGMLDNGTLIPENKCYCDGKCIPSGMLNISTCRSGAPLFGSLPHFYGADPIYGSMVEGIKPEESKHESYVILEPISGMPLDAVLRLQVNVKMSPIKYISMYEDVPEVYLPVFWLEQVLSISNDISWKLWLISHAPTICPVAGGIFVLSGFLVFAYVIRKLVNEMSHKRKRTIQFLKEKEPLNQSTNLTTRKLSYVESFIRN